MTLAEAKFKYNELLLENKRYDSIFGNKAISVGERQCYLSGYELIVKNINQIADIIARKGHEMTDEEWTEGFNV